MARTEPGAELWAEVKEQEMRSGHCPKCESREIVADVTIIDRSRSSAENELTAHVDGPVKEALLISYSTPERAHLRAWICGACGYTELYTEGAERLLEDVRDLLEAQRRVVHQPDGGGLLHQR